MAVAEETRRVVPRGDLQGSLGSGEKRWGKAYVGNVGNVYDTVADMVADLELMEGSTVETNGKNSLNDGLAAKYSIREKLVSDVNDGDSIIFLANGNVAEKIMITDSKLMISDIRNLVEVSLVDAMLNPQGATYNSKKNEILLCFTNETTQKIQALDADTLAVKDTYDYTELGHANSMTYCEKTNKIYVAYCRNDTLDRPEPDYKIAVIDAETMNFENYITFDFKIVSFAYDKAMDVFVAVNGSSYIGTSNFEVRIFDADMNLLRTSTYPQPFPIVGNGLCAYKGNFLFLTLSGYIQGDYFGNIINVVKTTRKTDGDMNVLEIQDSFLIGDFVYTVGTRKRLYGKVILFRHDAGNVSNADKTYTEVMEQLNVDLDTLLMLGTYYVYSDTPNDHHYPANGTSDGFLEVQVLAYSENNPVFVKQIFYRFGSSIESTRQIYARYIRYDVQTPAWSGWTRVDVAGLQVKEKNITGATINGNTYTSIELDVSETGLTAIGVVGFNVATASDISVNCVYINTSTQKASIRVYNHGSQRTENIIFYVLYY